MNKSERTDCITIKEINQILSSYRIGKKPLAKLLGWGETTIIRYVEGDIPTREYSEKLRHIMQDAGYFNKLLEENKSSLTPVAYRKCSQAVNERLLESKIKVVAQHIINKMEGHISLFELQIYLYYVQGFYLALEDKAMFEDEFVYRGEFMPYEEVSEDFAIRKIPRLEIKKNALTEKEKNFINVIVGGLSLYGPSVLERMVGYDLMILKLSRDNDNHRKISKTTIANYFKKLVSDNDIKSITDIYVYLNQIYIMLLKADDFNLYGVD